MNNKNPKEIFFVISDFRPWSFFVAFSELKKNKQNNFIVIYSQRWIYANDYGTFFPVWYKKLFISMLRLFFNVVMVEERRLSEKLNVDWLSIKSSKAHQFTNNRRFAWSECLIRAFGNG